MSKFDKVFDNVAISCPLVQSSYCNGAPVYKLKLTYDILIFCNSFFKLCVTYLYFFISFHAFSCFFMDFHVFSCFFVLFLYFYVFYVFSMCFYVVYMSFIRFHIFLHFYMCFSISFHVFFMFSLCSYGFNDLISLEPKNTLILLILVEGT